MTLLDTIEEVKTETKALNSSFSKLVPNLQLGWDQTSLNALMSCAQLYKYSIIDGFRGAINDDIQFGHTFAGALETYDRVLTGNFDDKFCSSLLEFGVPEETALLAQREGSSHEAALVITLRYVLWDTWDKELNRPWSSLEPTKTRATLLRSIIWYLDEFKDDPLKTLVLSDGRPAVERSFRFSLAELGEDFTTTDGEEYLLCGHMDRIVEWNGGIYITDNKTTKYALDDYYFKQYTPDNQVSLYSIAGLVAFHQAVDGVIIDGMQVQVEGSRFRRKPISRSKEQLEEWLTDLKFWLSQAENYARKNHWPKNPKSCGYGHRQCQFRPVCSSEPIMREELLNALYTKRTWDPLQPR